VYNIADGNVWSKEGILQPGREFNRQLYFHIINRQLAGQGEGK
jgi:hypothetical protein